MSNFNLKRIIQCIDHRTGLFRGWGLILYSSLPSSLGTLDILNLKISNTSIKIQFILFAIIPLLVLFLLIRANQEKWFIDKEYSNFRALFMLITILLISTIVCGIALLMKEEYIFSLNYKGIIEGGIRAFVMAISSLVVSATLLMSILSKKAILPGIPHQDTIDIYNQIKPNLRFIQKHEIWFSKNVEEDFPKELLAKINELENDYNNLKLTPIHDMSLEAIMCDIERLRQILNEIDGKKGFSKELDIEGVFEPIWKGEKADKSLERLFMIKI